jgi:hypothetical protein
MPPPIQKAHSRGKLWMESKAEIVARGVKSPDVADAFCIAFAVQPLLAYSWMPYDDSAALRSPVNGAGSIRARR